MALLQHTSATYYKGLLTIGFACGNRFSSSRLLFNVLHLCGCFVLRVPRLTLHRLPETDGDRAIFLRWPLPLASSATRRGRAVVRCAAAVAADEEYYDLHITAGNTSQLIHPDRRTHVQQRC